MEQSNVQDPVPLAGPGSKVAATTSFLLVLLGIELRGTAGPYKLTWHQSMTTR
ncbi:hypothetical protein CCH79_00018289 [Gambusia affinis]|uniref:Uncharacterized protein n=1 Tax=Gambusia affinis TaxID=33528 RepID=A0A315VXV3_GAMAF|nr:hypothetical protein CCH79_00018289 [Gambusia affinis]